MNRRRVKVPKGSRRKVVAKSKCGKTVTVEAQTKRGRLTFLVTASDGVEIQIDNSPEVSVDSTSHGG